MVLGIRHRLYIIVGAQGSCGNDRLPAFHVNFEIGSSYSAGLAGILASSWFCPARGSCTKSGRLWAGERISPGRGTSRWSRRAPRIEPLPGRPSEHRRPPDHAPRESASRSSVRAADMTEATRTAGPQADHVRRGWRADDVGPPETWTYELDDPTPRHAHPSRVR